MRSLVSLKCIYQQIIKDGIFALGFNSKLFKALMYAQEKQRMRENKEKQRRKIPGTQSGLTKLQLVL